MPTDENSVTIIARDAKFKGELVLDQAAKIFGSVEGRIVSGGEVHVAEGAVCKSTVEARSVIVDGVVEGDVIARERLSLSGKARVKGDINAAAIIVAEGATYSGQCRVGPQATKAGEDSEIEPKPRVARLASLNGPSGNSAPATTTPTPSWLQSPKATSH
jgi:cytoskeletal protein CcmA (bactofilin family)